MNNGVSREQRDSSNISAKAQPVEKRKLKDSGIPWIGEIPSHWETCSIKQILRNKSVKGFPNEQVLSLYREYGVVPKDSRDDNHNVTSEDTSGYKLVDIGDFVINKMKAWQGSMAVSEYRGIISPAYYICRFTAPVYKRYIHYLLRNETYKAEYMRLSTGLRIGQWDLNVEDFLHIPMVLPPIAEQQAIADFLDKKCSEIDELISLQEKIIEELKAYKKSVITEAVTKGLNPNATMKDSGIPWIVKIPSHWRLFQTSTLFHEHKEKNNGLKEKNLLSLSYGQIKRKDINSSEGLLPQSFETYNIIEKGDIVFRLTDLQNDKRSLRTGLCKERGIITSAYVSVRANTEIDSRYFHYLYHSYDICKVFYGLGDGVRQGMNYDDLKKLLVFLPPFAEQQAIADYLDKKCSEIDSLIALKQDKIEYLKEYKKSIIYEYTTGKKEVKERKGL